MEYKYKHFIPQNAAPKGVKQIGVYDENGKRICGIPLGTLAPPQGVKLYSFGLIADLHFYLSAVAWNPEIKVDNALTVFENEGCAFCCHCGDMTQTGFYREGNTETLVTGQFSNYKTTVEKHSISVYGICGNHESYVKAISNNLTELKTYTGNDLYYKFEYQNDVFIFCGQSAATTPMSDEAFTFLSETLAANSNKRCFVFVHPIYTDDSGDVNKVYSNSSAGGALLSTWNKGAALKTLLAQYPKAILLHGHSHFIFEEQEKDKSLNYTNKNGFHSVHVPSVSRPAYVNEAGVRTGNDTESYGTIVDVYSDCVYFRGIKFGTVSGNVVINQSDIPLGTLKINVAEGT